MTVLKQCCGLDTTASPPHHPAMLKQPLQTRHARALCRAVAITVDLKKTEGFGPKLKDFRAGVDKNLPSSISELKRDVESFASQFPTIGFDKGFMRYKN